jgi:hypothetical protein
MDRLVLLVPADAIALVARATEHLDDLPAARRSAADLVDSDPIAGPDTGTRFDGSGSHSGIESPCGRRVIGRSSGERAAEVTDVSGAPLGDGWRL